MEPRQKRKPPKFVVRDKLESRNAEDFGFTGGIIRPDNELWPRRRKGTLTISASGKSGGISSLPGVKWDYYVRYKLRPLNVPPTTVMDAEGKPIAKIVVDPVTGKRERVLL